MGPLRVKSVYEHTVAVNYGFRPICGSKFRLPVTKVHEGGEQPWSAAVGRPPWFLRTMLTHGGELRY